MKLVTTTKTEPGGQVRELGEQFKQRFAFLNTGNRLASQELRPGVDERLHSWAMPVDELLLREAVVAAVFASVCQQGAIATNRGRHQWAQASAAIG